jgi:hypothetical protein
MVSGIGIGDDEAKNVLLLLGGDNGEPIGYKPTAEAGPKFWRKLPVQREE